MIYIPCLQINSSRSEEDTLSCRTQNFSRHLHNKLHVVFQKVVLDSQKLSESIISVVALLFLKDMTNAAFCVTILTFPYLLYVLVLEQGNKIPFFPVSKIFHTSETHVFHLHSTYSRIGSFILPVVNQILFSGI